MKEREMTKAELVEKIYNKHSSHMTKRLTGDLVDTMFDQLANCIKKDKRFSYPGFGTWTVRNRKARKGRNPQTGEAIKIKASKTVGFRPAKTLKGGL